MSIPVSAPTVCMLAAYDLTGRGTDDDGQPPVRFAGPAGLRSVAGVESVALASSVPLDIHGLPVRTFTLEGRARPKADPDRGALEHRHARLLRRRWGFHCWRGVTSLRWTTRPRRHRRS